MSAIDQLLKIRKQKLETLKKKGINPYPARCKRDQVISQARKVEGKSVAVVGRIMSLRGHGKLVFADLRDESGKIQIAFKADLISEKTFDLLQLFDIGDFLSVQGEVGKTVSGEITVFASDFQIITKSIRPLPDKWYGLKDIEERYRKRYLDILMNPEVKKVFEMRSKIISAMREFLIKRGYIEVETPVLQPIYGGGLARPFKTYHNALGIPLYMRISTELYLKRLIVAGVEKVFEIARVFRNEGIDKDHNPEFTILETMEAYVDYQYNMKLVEKMTEYAVEKTTGSTKVNYQGQEIDFKTPWKRMKMVEAVKNVTGVDFSKITDLKIALKVAEKLGLELEEYHKSAVGLILAAAFEEKVESTLIQPTIIYDYPVETSPLAKKCESDQRFVERWEHYIAGKESSNNYSELNDPEELTSRFQDERKKERLGDVETHQTDEDFIEAMEYGMPPTSGIGPGIDRLVLIITNSTNLREVILFPTLRPLSGMVQDDGLRGDRETRIKSEKDNKLKSKGGYMFTRDQALELLHKNMQNKNLRKHCYAVEAVMKALAKHFGEDEEVWGIAGLLHDADYELTRDDLKKHVHTVVSWLKEAQVDDRIIKAVFAHGWKFVEGCSEPSNNMEWSLYCCDELTGLIVAVALVRPDKKLSSVTVDSILKKWNVKAFAAGVNRQQIEMCEEKLGIKPEEFIGIALAAMQEISGELGL